MQAWKGIAAALSGMVTVMSFAPFYGVAVPVAMLAAWVMLVAQASSWREAMGIGLTWGIGFFGLGVQWVYTTVYVVGGMPQVLAWVMYALFALYLSVYPALVAGFMHALRRCLMQRNRYSAVAVWGFIFPVVWVTSEWMRGEGSLGFNWLTLGYSQAGITPLAGWARWVGVYGVSFWLVALAGTLAVLCQQAAVHTGSTLKKYTAIWCAALGVLLLAGQWALMYPWTQPGTSFTVSLIQGNVDQKSKWDDEWQLDIFRRYTRLLNEAKGQLVVVPETALPVLREQLPALWVSELNETFRQQGRTALLGLVESEGKAAEQYYNSLWSYGLYANQGYRKRHLVPFGEYIPGIEWLGFFQKWWTIPLASFLRGQPDPVPLNMGHDIKIAPTICYEDGFSGLLRGQAGEITLLLNISNDAWFGNGVAIDQHLQIARMRSIESAKPMIRSNNTAGTAIIGASGAIVKALPPFREAILEGQVTIRRGTTPFTRYGNGLMLGLGISSLMMAAGWVQYVLARKKR